MLLPIEMERQLITEKMKWSNYTDNIQLLADLAFFTQMLMILEEEAMR